MAGEKNYPARRFRVRCASLRLHPRRAGMNRKSGDSSKTFFYFLEIKSIHCLKGVTGHWLAVIVD
jgi:hypothetical protein